MTGFCSGSFERIQLKPRTMMRRARASLVSEAMSPDGTTERWHRFAAAANKRDMAAALTELNVIEAATAEEEAEAVALMLREVAETPGGTAALVTPDRVLARRVAARLEVWDLDVEDTAGQPFAKTIPGALLDLVAAAVEKAFEPAALVTLLKHPLCRLGMAVAEMRSATQALELAAFRSPYFGKGLEGVEAALEKAQVQSWRHAAVSRLRSADWQAARHLVRRLAQAFAPMVKGFASPKPASLHALARLHFETAQELARAGDRELDIIARATVVALTALFAAYFFISREYSKQLWLLLAMCPVMLEILRRDHAAELDKRGRPL